MTGGTFTITNLGGIGIGHFTPIINDPEVAILGIGRSNLRTGLHRWPVAAAPDDAAEPVVRSSHRGRSRRRAIPSLDRGGHSAAAVARHGGLVSHD